MDQKKTGADMATRFNPQEIEADIYKSWEESGAFVAHRVEGKKPFTIVMPPPNITGQLHMGHAMDCIMQDAPIRYHRMKGDPTLWLPGTDHAAIATEVRIVNAMREEGLTKEGIGREAFLERAWNWKKEYGGRIVHQQRKMGISCDWTRERFTMDEGCSRAVREVFVRLYAKVEDTIVIQQDPSKQIFGTGHNAVINIPGTDEWYIVYHRFTRPEGVKMGLSGGYNREVCIDRMKFNPDGTIIPVKPTL